MRSLSKRAPASASGTEATLIVIVDASRIDAERATVELTRAGVAGTMRIVTNHAELRTVLGTFAPDIVISELLFPELNGYTVQRVVNELRPGVPIIFTSASNSDEVAGEAVRSGAVDYVPKGNLFRLPRAVKEALREGREQRRLRTSSGDKETTRRQAERLESVWRIVNDPGVAGNELAAVLGEAAASIGRGSPYAGFLAHADRGELLIDATTAAGGAEPAIVAGSRHALDDVFDGRTFVDGRTDAWPDVAADSHAPAFVREAGLRCAIATQFRSSGTGYALIFGSPEVSAPTPFDPEDYAFIEVIGSIIARHLEREARANSQRSAESYSQNHRRRLDALWRMVSNPNLHGEELFVAMLREAAGAVRPGQTFGGTLGHVEGHEFVLDAFWVGEVPLPAVAGFRVGMRIALSDTLHVKDLSAGRTQAWEDCQTIPDLPARARAAGLRSQIMTQFTANANTYVLTLGSLEPPAGAPFSTQDFEYIEVLGSIFARELELDAIGGSLRDARARTLQHTERLDAFWRIVNDPTKRGQDLVRAVLTEATAKIQPGRSYVGVLRHLEETHFVIDAVSAERWPADGNARRLLAVGRRIAIRDTLVHELGPGSTRCWEDLQLVPDLPARLRSVGWRRQIATGFSVAGTTYDLTLGSLEEQAPTPWAQEDIEYIEVIASVLARQLDLELAQHSLSTAESRVRQHAERLEALWRVANNPALGGQELVLAMLRHGAAAIRPGQHFRGVLCRIDGADAVIVGVGADPSNSAKTPAQLRIGARRPLATIMASVGRTQYWDDVTTLGADLPKGPATLRWRGVITTTFDAGNARYSLTFGSTEPASPPFGSADSGFVEVLASSFAGRLQVDTLEVSLREAEARSRQHAERLETLWQIINSSSLRDNELVEAMLKQAAATIQPGQDFDAILVRVQGDDAIIEAIASPIDIPKATGGMKVGAITPLATTALGRVLEEGGGTRSWDDVQSSAYSAPATRARATRALVITTFKAGPATWALAFTSTRTARQPLSQQDHAYVEVIASFFANHLQQRWQFDRIQYQQSHDVLTGLLNRSTWRSQARIAARALERYAVIFVDVDGLHEVNEAFGHIIGDAILVEVGNALRRGAREGELVGRLGGDVFGIFVPDSPTQEDLFARVYAFAGVFDHPFSTGDREGKEFVARTACIGVACAPDNGTQFESILSKADAALFTAQERGHASTVFYVSGMEAEAQRRATLHNELREAIALDQFVLHFQPHVDLDSGRVTGCEALIRWNHPERGVVMPADFIPFAEQTGLIVSIDAWVMQNAFVAANDLSRQRPEFRLYFNLSGRQAGDPRVVRAFIEAARSGLSLSTIGVEITESDAMRDVDATRHVCRALRRLNVRIAIDDFGTGYSSLSSLKRLPVDIVKIDRAFVSGILSDPHDEIITETIIAISRQFGFETLAEGAENPGELDWLRKSDCRYVQGYVVCHPLPLGEFKTWLDERAGTSISV
jgi:diguanylate cyclase (GGDEF)-like protein